MKRLLLLISLFPVSGWALDFTIEHYTFQTDDDQGSFSVNRGTYSETWGAIIGVDFRVRISSGTDTCIFTGNVQIPPRTTLPTAASVRTGIQTYLQNNNANERATQFFITRTNERKKANRFGVVGSVVGQTVTVP